MNTAQRLWVDLGLLGDQAAVRHAEGSLRPEGDAAREELRKSLQEDQVCAVQCMSRGSTDDTRIPNTTGSGINIFFLKKQDLLAAQQQLAGIFASHSHRQPLPQDSAAAAAVLARGQCLEPALTVRVLVEQVARRPTREAAVDAALMVRIDRWLFL